MTDRMVGKGGRPGGTMRAFARWFGNRMGGRPVPRGTVRAPDNIDESGVWGVGGPAMREPGSTGIVSALQAPPDDTND